jgi:hypothetical protein
MTEHLPECPILKPCCDDEQFPEHGFCGNYVGRCLHCMAECICDALRACEARVREDERSSNFTPDDHADGMTESYHRGFDDARWIAAKEALEGVQHENCDCEPCQAIARALAELRTIGLD